MGFGAATEEFIYDMFKLAIIEYLFQIVGHIGSGAGAAVVILVLIVIKSRKAKGAKPDVDASGANRPSVRS